MYKLFEDVLMTIYRIVGSHGMAVILFTVLIKTILLPFDFKSRKSMRRMEKVNPQLQVLQKKYATDKEKLQKKQAELYKKEKINPLGSCLPMLLTFPVMIVMFGAMRNVANIELVKSMEKLPEAVATIPDSTGVMERINNAIAQNIAIDESDRIAIEESLPDRSELTEPFLWIKNLWMADSPFTSVLPASSTALATVGKSIAGVATEEQMTALSAFVDSGVYQKVILPHYNAVILPNASINLLITNLQIYKTPNGFFILPILAFVTQLFSGTLNPQQQNPQGGQQAGGGALMKWGFPIFSIFICATSTAAFSLYWVVTNLVAMASTYAFRMYFEAQDRKVAALNQEVDKL